MSQEEKIQVAKRFIEAWSKQDTPTLRQMASEGVMGRTSGSASSTGHLTIKGTPDVSDDRVYARVSSPEGRKLIFLSIGDDRKVRDFAVYNQQL